MTTVYILEAKNSASRLPPKDLPALHPALFDRLFVAQALAEPLRLITHDRAVAAHSDSVILV